MGTGASKPVGRPRNQRRRKAILDAAGLLYASNGISGPTMRDVARAARIPASVLQRYFPTKAVLLDACMADGIERFDLLVSQTFMIARHRHDPEELLREAGRIYARFLHEARPFYTLWLIAPSRLEHLAQSLPARIDDVHAEIARALGPSPSGSLAEAIVNVRAFYGALFAGIMFFERIGCRDPFDDDFETSLRLLARSTARAVLSG